MGDSPAHGVIDHQHWVWGCDGLYVLTARRSRRTPE